MHDPRCEEGDCHPDCEVRRHAIAEGRPYPGKVFDPRDVTRLRNIWVRDCPPG